MVAQVAFNIQIAVVLFLDQVGFDLHPRRACTEANWRITAKQIEDMLKTVLRSAQSASRRSILPMPGIPTLLIYPPAVPGTFAVVHHAPGHVVNCTAEALQMSVPPRRIGTIGTPVRLSERQSSPSTYGGSIPGKFAALHVNRFAAAPHLLPSQPGQMAQVEQSPLLLR